MTPTPEVELDAPWGEHSLPPEGEATVEIGPLTLWVRSRADEIWLAHVSGDWTSRGGAAVREPPSDEEGWVRWPVPKDTDGIRLTPAFPPRPLVVKPELSFRLLPRSGARIFVRVPLWVRVEARGGEGAVLTEIPTVVLSDTWWGEVTEGELGYWLPTTARRRVTPGRAGPHQAVCPLDLSNRSDSELEVRKIALRVAHLSIFAGKEGFWSDVTRVRYRGEAEGSDIDVAGRAPDEAGEATRLADPRSPLTRSFRARSFSRLRSLSGLGGV